MVSSRLAACPTKLQMWNSAEWVVLSLVSGFLNSCFYLCIWLLTGYQKSYNKYLNYVRRILVNSFKTCHKIILGHRNFCLTKILRQILKTLSVNQGPSLVYLIQSNKILTNKRNIYMVRTPHTASSSVCLRFTLTLTFCPQNLISSSSTHIVETTSQTDGCTHGQMEDMKTMRGEWRHNNRNLR